MFANTYKLISEAGIQYLHIFPYSPREGTPAARMPQIEKHVRKERVALLRQQGELELQRFMLNNIGRQAKIIVEKEQYGRTDNFIPVILQEKHISGSLINCALKLVQNNAILAEVA